MMNNPFNSGTHLPDVTVITPVFDAAGENIIYTVASRGHQADIAAQSQGPPHQTAVTSKKKACYKSAKPAIFCPRPNTPAGMLIKTWPIFPLK